MWIKSLWLGIKSVLGIATSVPAFSCPEDQTDSKDRTIRTSSSTTLHGDMLDKYKRPEWVNEAYALFDAWEADQERRKRQEAYREWRDNCKEVFSRGQAA